MTTVVIRRERSPVIVERTGTVREVTPAGQAVVVERTRAPVTVERRSTATAVQVERAPVKVQVAGLQGPPGPQGPEGPQGEPGEAQIPPVLDAGFF